jgi:hypothetical protein
MITWTFDLTALFIGWAVGMLMGVLVVALSEMRDGGSWSKGFFEGCDKEFLINYLNREKEEMKKERNNNG